MTCPHCGHEADPGRETCPLCGTPLAGAGSEADADRADVAAEPGSPESAGGADDGRGEAGPQGGELTPWEAGGGVTALAASWWESLADPARFFSRLDWRAGLWPPLLYYLFFSVVGAAFQSLWNALLTPALFSALGGGELMAAAGAGSPLLGFFLSPFRALLGLALAAALMHPVARLVSDRARSIGATARVVCYAAGPQVLLVVPFLGGLAGAAWTAVLVVLGIREAHRTSTARAAAVLGVAFVAGMLLATVLVAFLAAVGALDALPLPT